MTITSRLDSAPERQEIPQANWGFRGRQISIGVPFERQHECDGPEAIANLARTKRMRALQGLRGSQRANLDRNDADSRASGTVNHLAANLATFARGPILSLRHAARVVMLDVPVVIGGQHAVGHGLGKGRVDAVKGVHGCVSRFDGPYIGPLVLHVNRLNACPVREDTRGCQLKQSKPKGSDMSPEQRAEQIVDAVFLSGSKWGEHDWEFAKGRIASAIRDAEDAKREECADVADHALHGVSLASVDPVFAEGMLEGISLAARLIRAHATPLKSQEP